MHSRVVLLTWIAIAGWAAAAPAADRPGARYGSRGASHALAPAGPPVEQVDEGFVVDDVEPSVYIAQHPNPHEPLGFSASYFDPQARPMMVDPAASSGAFDGPVIEEYDAHPVDPFAPAPAVSSGDWLRNGFWYTEQSAVYLSRTAMVKNDVQLAFDFTFPQEQLNVQLDLGFEPGLRSTLGRYLGRDSNNRDHSVEFTFLGLTHWQYAQSLSSADGQLVSPLDPGFTVPVYTGSTVQALDQTSDFNSYEFNYRIDRRPGRDRKVYSRDGCWIREATPRLLGSFFAGLRVAIVNERIQWFADATEGTGNYDVVTHNNMVGPQIGADLFVERAYWRVGTRIKAAPLVNWASQSSTVRILDTDGEPLVPNRDEFAKDHTMSFVGELSFVGEYRFRPNFGLRASYDLMWVTDLALAQNQLTFFPSIPAEISDSHALFFQGVSLGLEWYR